MKEIVDSFKRYFIYVGLLSIAIDVLMLTPPLFVLSTLDKVLSSRSNETLLVLLGLALYGVLIMSLLDSVRIRLLSRFGATFKTKLAPRMLALNLHSPRLPELARHALEDVNELESFLTGPGIRALFEIPWIPVLIAVLYLFHPLLAMTAVLLAAILLALTIAEHRLTAAHRKRAMEILRQANSFGVVARQNAEVVGSMGMQAAITERWSQLNASYLDHKSRATKTAAAIQGVSKFVRVGGQVGALAIGAALVLNLQDVTAGIMMASLIIMGRTLGPIDHVIGALNSFITARAAYDRLNRLLEDSQANDPPSLQLPRPQGNLQVHRVFLQTAPGQRLLNGISFELTAGQSLGIIGPSGSGKTTLARLIVGLGKPTQGQVRIDGAEVFDWATADLGQYIGYLPQEVVLFPGTIAENIARMKDPEANADAVIAAAKKARVHSTILKLPNGYDTEVGEGGARLSGGQRQLVGLARALFGGPSIVVLDEPNSSLDSSAELALAEVIRSLKVSRVSLIVIAHKPSMIRDMDKLLVLRNGEQQLFGPCTQVLQEMNADRMLEAPKSQGRPAALS